MTPPTPHLPKDGVIRFLTLDEVAERRTRYLHDVLLPQVDAHFRKHQTVRSAVFSVAQYYVDEAVDEVHPAWEFRKDGAATLHTESPG